MSEENKEQAILDQLAAILTEDAEQVEATEQAVAEQVESTEQAVDVEALQKENAELRAQLADYDEQASTMLSARTTKLSEQNKKKVEDLLAFLKRIAPCNGLQFSIQYKVLRLRASQITRERLLRRLVVNLKTLKSLEAT